MSFIDVSEVYMDVFKIDVNVCVVRGLFPAVTDSEVCVDISEDGVIECVPVLCGAVVGSVVLVLKP